MSPPGEVFSVTDYGPEPRPATPPVSAAGPASPRAFLGVHYVRCRVYGRLYRDEAAGVYAGRCPRCGAHAHVRIGPGGTSQRFFQAYCP
ncbi:MAG: hypothetical protein EA425_02760 [Puniceicoccaceae bacterium]|nr:MAG: hypothetical protein EA425_02760 [Puniceicoccaceae bacterium]